MSDSITDDFALGSRPESPRNDATQIGDATSGEVRRSERMRCQPARRDEEVSYAIRAEQYEAVDQTRNTQNGEDYIQILRSKLK